MTKKLTKKDIETVKQALEILEGQFSYKEDVFTSVAASKSFFRLKLGFERKEVFAVAFLNTKHELIEYKIMTTGTIDRASVYPREIVRECLLNDSAAIIASHNHPTSITTPSNADKSITETLSLACSLLDIKLLDHIIVGKKDAFSFAENGLL